VGRPDQHVAEVLLASAAMLGFVGAWSAERLAVRRASVAALGLAVALAFWTWLGSALVLVVPVAFVGLAHVVLPDDHPAGSRIPAALAGGLGLGAALLAASLAVWGAPGALARGDLLGLTGLQVAVTALAAGFGAALWGARRLRARPSGPVRRLLEALGASAAALALLAAPTSLREGLRQGLTALGAANPWYADISEFQHLLLSCQAPLAADASSLVQLYGLTLPAALLAIPPLCRRWADPAERPRVLLLATWGGAYLMLALLRRRFAPYAVVPMALLSVEAVTWAAGRFAARAGSGRRSAVQAALGAAGVALVLAPALPALSSVGETPAGWIDAMRWLGEQPVRPGREAALTQWPLGHLALYYAGKPVLATPFGTEGGAGAMPAVARFALSPRPVDAEALLADRQVGWVVLADPVVDAWVDQAMVGEGRPVLVHRSCTIAGGKVDELEAAFLGLEAPRLYYFDGNAPPGAAAAPIDGLRLVYESRPIPAAPEAPAEQAKVFTAVTGARLEVTGAAPGRPVTATVRLLTNQGRETGWRTVALADEAGVAHLRLPYATGPNGAIQASPWTVEDGVSVVALETREDDVSLGRTLGVALRGPDDIRR
jgi:asparagine N-glycosylation enzyme membrane subunit Stt3